MEKNYSCHDDGNDVDQSGGNSNSIIITITLLQRLMYNIVDQSGGNSESIDVTTAITTSIKKSIETHY